ncbi:HtaA domain-containing protein, partial [Streptomyces sp. t39]|uniref:HtaA domain-containing protein n=1 Tax=Streptomyces sp. t39 TaxID=1828156 RepID=UPI0011CE05A8
MLPFPPARTPAVLFAALTALLGFLLPAGGAAAAAPAEPRTVQGGRLDWGLKSSFQSYVTGPIAQGTWSLTGGAATVGGSQFRFHSADGTYDPSTGAFRAGFAGGVHFLGHRGPGGAYELDLAVSRPTVRITGGRGTLHLDVVSKERGTGKVTRGTQIAFADLDLSGVDMRGGTSPVALRNIPATLTARGRWTLSGGALDGGALFRFPGGKGTYDAARRTLDASFAGSVRFTGDGLDLTLSAVTVTVDGGKGTLRADITGASGRTRAVPLITFTARDFAPKDGLVRLTEAPARLTAEGSRAFGGLYRADTVMDPVSLAVAVTDAADLPALPDLGSDVARSSPRASAAPSQRAPGTAAGNTAPTSSSPAGVLGGVGAAVLLAAALAAAVLVRRRRARAAAGPDSGVGDGHGERDGVHHGVRPVEA